MTTHTTGSQGNDNKPKKGFMNMASNDGKDSKKSSGSDGRKSSGGNNPDWKNGSSGSDGRKASTSNKK